MKLQLPDVNIYYEIEGSGPLLFIIQSGEGNAQRTKQLVDELKGHYRVVTYDRRGLSHSIQKTQTPVTLTSHSNDLYRLISSISRSPVNVLGCSIGATIALETAFHHPMLIKTIIAHEPIMPSLLPKQEQVKHIRELKEIQRIYFNEDWISGIKQMAKVLGIDPKTQTKEPGAYIEPMHSNRKANFDFFVKYDFQSIIDFNFPKTHLTEIEKSTTIIPSVGKETNPNVFDYICAEVMAKVLNKKLVQFPGGHNGNCTHPKGYSKLLKSLLKN